MYCFSQAEDKVRILRLLQEQRRGRGVFPLSHFEGGVTRFWTNDLFTKSGLFVSEGRSRQSRLPGSLQLQMSVLRRYRSRGPHREILPDQEGKETERQNVSATFRKTFFLSEQRILRGPSSDHGFETDALFHRQTALPAVCAGAHVGRGRRSDGRRNFLRPFSLQPHRNSAERALLNERKDKCGTFSLEIRKLF